MEYVRVGAIQPPTTSRSGWARTLLQKAMTLSLTPVPVPLTKIVEFTCNLPPELSKWLKLVADKSQIPLEQASAGLLAALEISSSAQGDHIPSDQAEWLDHVNHELHDVGEAALAAMNEGKVAFIEAATGTGKGRLILALAHKMIEAKRKTLISAPLAVTWQLLQEFRNVYPDSLVSITVALGRSNFVSPVALAEWVDSLQAPNEGLRAWIEEGGRAVSSESLALSKMLNVDLCWLAEEAASFLDEPLPGSLLLSEADPEEGCSAEAVYRSLKGQAVDSDLVFCSHHYLASLLKMSLYQEGSFLSSVESLVVDEAHLLEQAVSSIFSETLHIHGRIRQARALPGTGKAALINALELLGGAVTASVDASGKRRQGPPSEFPEIQKANEDLLRAVTAYKPPKRNAQAGRFAGLLKGFARDVASERTAVHPELTPVLKYPCVTAGQSNLDGVFKRLWEGFHSAALVSATLYTDAESGGGLMRWKLGVPKDRAKFLPAVIPSWVRSPVHLMPMICDRVPDDSPEWTAELAHAVKHVAANAQGGTLVLTTSYDTAGRLSDLLEETLAGRLLRQPTGGAAAVAKRFVEHKGRPVWVGVGSAWTGINLVDHSVPAEQDQTLTDLVICRLPFGVNRSLSHHRRTVISGRGVVVQEAVWFLRQGIGRLVRRKGTPRRNLWILDARIRERSSWMGSFTKLLKSYRS